MRKGDGARLHAAPRPQLHTPHKTHPWLVQSLLVGDPFGVPWTEETQNLYLITFGLLYATGSFHVRALRFAGVHVCI